MSDEHRARAIVEVAGMKLNSIPPEEYYKFYLKCIELSGSECLESRAYEFRVGPYNGYLLELIREKLDLLQENCHETSYFKDIDISASAEAIYNELPELDKLCETVEENENDMRSKLKGIIEEEVIEEYSIKDMLRDTHLTIYITAYPFDTAFEFPLYVSVPIGTETYVKNLCKKLHNEGPYSGFAERFREFLAKEKNPKVD